MKRKKDYTKLVGYFVKGVVLWTDKDVQGKLVGVYDDYGIIWVCEENRKYEVYLSSIELVPDGNTCRYPDDIDGCGITIALIVAVVACLIYLISMLWK